MNKIPVKICLLLLGALIFSSCEQEELMMKYPVEQHTLSNGLKVLLIEDHSVPLVAYSTWYKVGSLWEKEGATGLAHLFEHLLFKGTKKFKEKEFVNFLESHGSVVNAQTQKNLTLYYEIFSKDYLEKIIHMESDRMQGLILNDAQLDSERKVVLEERKLRLEGNFSAQHLEELYQLVYLDHPYGNPVIGYESDLKKLTTQDCLNFYSDFYQPSNALVVIAGDIDLGDAKKLLKRYYEPLKSKPAPKLNVQDMKAQDGERRKVIFRPVSSDSILVGYRIPKMDHPDISALSILNFSYFEITSGMAMRELIREKELLVGFNTNLDFGFHDGLFIISMDLRRNVPAEEALKEFDLLIEEVKTKPLTEKELERVKNHLAFSLASEARSALGVSNLFAFSEYYYGNYKHVYEEINRIRNMTSAEILRVARVYLNSTSRSIVTMKALPGVIKK